MFILWDDPEEEEEPFIIEGVFVDKTEEKEVEDSDSRPDDKDD